MNTLLTAVRICSGEFGVAPGGKNVPSPSGNAPNTGIRKLYSWKEILSFGMVPGGHDGTACALALGAAITVAARPAAATAASVDRIFTSLSFSRAGLLPGPSPGKSPAY